MSDTILVLNAGSSNVKFTVFPAAAEPTSTRVLCKGMFRGVGHQARFVAEDSRGETLAAENVDGPPHFEGAVEFLLKWLHVRFPGFGLCAVGHRLVHGGTQYAAPVRIDAHVMTKIRHLIPLAPLHQPQSIAAIEAVVRLCPNLLQVACFDTAFHRTQPSSATLFALPRSLSAEGLRRYGFHGLSYEYIAAVLSDVVGSELAAGRVVVAHLGSGASMCALRNRISIATTMGFSALDGLPMGRRCGSLDPGVVLYLQQQKGMNPTTVADLLYRRSGLLGVSGISDDMRVLLASDHPHAREAVDLFVYRVGRELGSLAAALNGLDALVFTAGIGEHAVEIRRRVCEAAAWLGVELDPAANGAGGPRLTRQSSRTSAWMIPTDENVMIARRAMQESG